MKKITKAFRIVGLILLIMLACMGIGITGHFLPTNRDKYRDAEIRVEQVDKREDEEEAEEDKS